mgnify:CR=1 FL=1
MQTISAIAGVSIIGYLIDSYTKKDTYVDTLDSNKNELLKKEDVIFEEIKPIVPVIKTEEKNEEIKSEKKLTHNNMVPFFAGSSAKQDMRGTGVSSGNWNSDDYNLGNDYTTNNYKTLATFTGIDDTYMHKRENVAMFTPLEQRDTSTRPEDDVSNIRPQLDRYKTSILHKNEMTPFESVKVGPGLNIGPEMANGGNGFHPERNTRIMPSNVGAYKLSQLPGRVNGTKYQASNLPTALPGSGSTNESGNKVYGVPKLRPEAFYTIKDREPMPTTVSATEKPTYKDSIVVEPSSLKKKENLASFGSLEPI